jgi:hypothetical protein
MKYTQVTVVTLITLLVTVLVNKVFDDSPLTSINKDVTETRITVARIEVALKNIPNIERDQKNLERDDKIQDRKIGRLEREMSFIKATLNIKDKDLR